MRECNNYWGIPCKNYTGKATTAQKQRHKCRHWMFHLGKCVCKYCGKTK